MKAHCLFLYLFLFNSLSSFAQSPSMDEPCGTKIKMQELASQNASLALEWTAYAQSKNASAVPNLYRIESSTLRVPVVVHIIHQSGEAIGSGRNLSEARILRQLRVLNEDYSRTNADKTNTPSSFLGVAANVDIQFCLAKKDPSGAATTGITRHVYNSFSDGDIESVIKPATTWDAEKYLNIWVLDMPSSWILGYSYLPLTSIVGEDVDGVVINYPYFGDGTASIGLGRTLTHEVGHYFGLVHPWENRSMASGCSNDDGISDTPLQSSNYFGCPSHPQTSCSSDDMFMNFMDYVDDHCMNLFTLGQASLMRNVILWTSPIAGFAHRKDLWLNNSAACGPSAIADNHIPDLQFFQGPNELVLQGIQSNTEFQIFDVKGSLLLKGALPNNHRIPLPRLAGGLYILQVRNAEGAARFKFMTP